MVLSTLKDDTEVRIDVGGVKRPALERQQSPKTLELRAALPARCSVVSTTGPQEPKPFTVFGCDLAARSTARSLPARA